MLPFYTSLFMIPFDLTLFSCLCYFGKLLKIAAFFEKTANIMASYKYHYPRQHKNDSAETQINFNPKVPQP